MKRDDVYECGRVIDGDPSGSCPRVKELSKLKRQAERRARHVIGLMDRNDSLRHEIRRLEDVLAWIYRTDADDVREVVARTIPQRLSRTEHYARAIGEVVGEVAREKSDADKLRAVLRDVVGDYLESRGSPRPWPYGQSFATWDEVMGLAGRPESGEDYDYVEDTAEGRWGKRPEGA